MGGIQSRRIAKENRLIAEKTSFSLDQVHAWRHLFMVCLKQRACLNRADYVFVVILISSQDVILETNRTRIHTS